MALNALLVALQGFAPGFALSPVAIAVQGLIELLQEERRSQVYGSGRLARSPHQPRRRRPDDGLTPELVQAQWELLEARLRAQEQDRETRERLQVPADEQPTPSPVTGLAPLQPPPSAAIQTGAVGLGPSMAGFPSAEAPQSRRQADDDALALILALS